MADAVGELGFQAYVTRGVQLHSRLLVFLRTGPYPFLEDRHLVLLPSVKYNIRNILFPREQNE